MRIRMPSKKVCREFHLTYELKGAQKGADVLTEYYGIPRMKIILDGRKVGRGNDADYFEGIACFTRKGLKKRNVLHELYHHVVEVNGIEMTSRKEEKEACWFAGEVIKRV